MTVTATSYEAIAAKYAADMLAACADWQALCGGTLAAAKAKIVVGWGGDPDALAAFDQAQAYDGSTFTVTPPYAVVRFAQVKRSLAGINQIDHDGIVDGFLVLARLNTAEPPPDAVVRMSNTAGNIRQQLQDLFGTAGALARGTADVEPPEFPTRDEDRYLDAVYPFSLTFEG